MAGKGGRLSRGVLVRLFLQDQFVDETLDLGIRPGHPGPLGGRHGMLQVFDEGHEIPYRVHMVLHEHPQIIEGVQGVINRVAGQPPLQVFDIFGFEQAHVHSLQADVFQFVSREGLLHTQIHTPGGEFHRALVEGLGCPLDGPAVLTIQHLVQRRHELLDMGGFLF